MLTSGCVFVYAEISFFCSLVSFFDPFPPCNIPLKTFWDNLAAFRSPALILLLFCFPSSCCYVIVPAFVMISVVLVLLVVVVLNVFCLVVVVFHFLLFNWLCLCHLCFGCCSSWWLQTNRMLETLFSHNFETLHGLYQRGPLSFCESAARGKTTYIQEHWFEATFGPAKT